jgi:hypothetical protein
LHAPAKQPSETTSATTQTPEEALAHIKAVYRVKRLESELTMITAQTKAMEALIYCMTPLQSTGDTKLDAFYAKERNRQRLAATQTLLHIRTVQREKRLRQTMRTKAKAKAEKDAMVGAEGAGHADNGSPVQSPAPSPPQPAPPTEPPPPESPLDALRRKRDEQRARRRAEVLAAEQQSQQKSIATVEASGHRSGAPRCPRTAL